MAEYDGVWPVKYIESWDEFEEATSGKSYRRWLFRGHSDISWKLESSLYRLFKDIKEIFEAKGKSRRFAKNLHEEQIVLQFKSQAHLYFHTLPSKDNNLEWLALMQHYGTPTRMLDMTFSPYVAAFFALESGYDDCCVYAIRPQYFARQDIDVFGNEEYEDNKKQVFADKRGVKSYIYPYEPEIKDERLVAQQGLFLVSSTNYQTVDEIIEIYDPPREPLMKYILKKQMRYEGLKKLRVMNISNATLFPGIDGFCKSLRFQVLDSVSILRRLC